MAWSPQQIAELASAGHHHPKPGVRVKALAVRAVALGSSHREAAGLFATSRQSIGCWVRRYREGGLSAWQVARGRGRKSRVDQQEVLDTIAQSPRHLGLPRSRWT